jgi:hypothetical protein
MSCVAAILLLLSLQGKAQRSHISMAGDRTFRMKVDAQRDLRIKKHERRYTEALAQKAFKRAKSSLDVVIVLKKEKKKESEKRSPKVTTKQ